MRMPCMQAVFQGVYQASVKGEGNAGHAAVCTAQSLLLQYHDGGDPRCPGGGQICGVQEAEAGEDGAGTCVRRDCRFNGKK